MDSFLPNKRTPLRRRFWAIPLWGMRAPAILFLGGPLLILISRTAPGEVIAQLTEPHVTQTLSLSLTTTVTTTGIVALCGTPLAYLRVGRDTCKKVPQAHYAIAAYTSLRNSPADALVKPLFSWYNCATDGLFSAQDNIQQQSYFRSVGGPYCARQFSVRQATYSTTSALLPTAGTGDALASSSDITDSGTSS
jgi:hypothetical protein